MSEEYQEHDANKEEGILDEELGMDINQQEDADNDIEENLVPKRAHFQHQSLPAAPSPLSPTTRGVKSGSSSISFQPQVFVPASASSTSSTIHSLDDVHMNSFPSPSFSSIKQIHSPLPSSPIPGGVSSISSTNTQKKRKLEGESGEPSEGIKHKKKKITFNEGVPGGILAIGRGIAITEVQSQLYCPSLLTSITNAINAAGSSSDSFAINNQNIVMQILNEWQQTALASIYFHEDINKLVSRCYPSDGKSVLDNVLATFLLFHPEYVKTIITPLSRMFLNSQFIYNKKSPPFYAIQSIISSPTSTLLSSSTRIDIELVVCLSVLNSQLYAQLMNIDTQGNTSNSNKSMARKYHMPLSSWLYDLLVRTSKSSRELYFSQLLAGRATYKEDSTIAHNNKRTEDLIRTQIHSLLEEESLKTSSRPSIATISAVLNSMESLHAYPLCEIVVPTIILACSTSISSISKSNSKPRGTMDTLTKLQYSLEDYKEVIKHYFQRSSTTSTRSLILKLLKQSKLSNSNAISDMNQLPFLVSNTSSVKKEGTLFRLFELLWNCTDAHSSSPNVGNISTNWFVDHFLDSMIEGLSEGIKEAEILLTTIFRECKYWTLLFGNPSSPGNILDRFVSSLFTAVSHNNTNNGSRSDGVQKLLNIWESSWAHYTNINANSQTSINGELVGIYGVKWKDHFVPIVQLIHQRIQPHTASDNSSEAVTDTDTKLVERAICKLFYHFIIHTCQQIIHSPLANTKSNAFTIIQEILEFILNNDSFFHFLPYSFSQFNSQPRVQLQLTPSLTSGKLSRNLYVDMLDIVLILATHSSYSSSFSVKSVLQIDTQEFDRININWIKLKDIFHKVIVSLLSRQIQKLPLYVQHQHQHQPLTTNNYSPKNTLAALLYIIIRDEDSKVEGTKCSELIWESLLTPNNRNKSGIQILLPVFNSNDTDIRLLTMHLLLQTIQFIKETKRTTSDKEHISSPLLIDSGDFIVSIVTQLMDMLCDTASTITQYAQLSCDIIHTTLQALLSQSNHEWALKHTTKLLQIFLQKLISIPTDLHFQDAGSRLLNEIDFLIQNFQELISEVEKFILLHIFAKSRVSSTSSESCHWISPNCYMILLLTKLVASNKVKLNDRLLELAFTGMSAYCISLWSSSTSSSIINANEHHTLILQFKLLGKLIEISQIDSNRALSSLEKYMPVVIEGASQSSSKPIKELCTSLANPVAIKELLQQYLDWTSKLHQLLS